MIDDSGILQQWLYQQRGGAMPIIPVGAPGKIVLGGKTVTPFPESVNTTNGTRIFTTSTANPNGAIVDAQGNLVGTLGSNVGFNPLSSLTGGGDVQPDDTGGDAGSPVNGLGVSLSASPALGIILTGVAVILVIGLIIHRGGRK